MVLQQKPVARFRTRARVDDRNFHVFRNGGLFPENFQCFLKPLEVVLDGNYYRELFYLLRGHTARESSCSIRP